MGTINPVMNEYFHHFITTICRNSMFLHHLRYSYQKGVLVPVIELSAMLSNDTTSNKRHMRGKTSIPTDTHLFQGRSGFGQPCQLLPLQTWCQRVVNLLVIIVHPFNLVRGKDRYIDHFFL